MCVFVCAVNINDIHINDLAIFVWTKKINFNFLSFPSFVLVQMQINITNSWTLPGLGYPVFYRYFRDKITWYEADAVCQFHHANLATGKANFNLLLFVRVIHTKRMITN